MNAFADGPKGMSRGLNLIGIGAAIAPYALAAALVVLEGCDLSAFTQHRPQPPDNMGAKVRDLKAELTVIDKEIELRIDEEYDIKWDLEARHGVRPERYRQMLDDQNRIIELRAKRAGLAYTLANIPGYSYVRDDSEFTIGANEILKPILVKGEIEFTAESLREREVYLRGKGVIP
jgi:hypothetical protein